MSSLFSGGGDLRVFPLLLTEGRSFRILSFHEGDAISLFMLFPSLQRGGEVCVFFSFKKKGGAQYPYWFYLFKEGGHL